MDFYAIKLSQWMLIGVGAGLLIGVAAALEPPPRDLVLRRPITPQQFIALLKQTRNGDPVVRDLVIHPPREGENYVTFEAMAPDMFKAFAFHAPIPCRIDGVEHSSIVEHARAVSARDPRIKFGYPWRESSSYIFLSRAGVGWIVASIWGAILWMIDGPPVRRRTIAKARAEVARVRQEMMRATPTPAQVQTAEVVDPAEPAPLKEYRGEFYPVEQKHAFSLVELLVVIGIIGVLIAITLPTMHRAKQSAAVAACASNLHQISIALGAYLVENQQTAFWRGAQIDNDGMDWWAWGGRETGNANHDPADYFNTMIPRPLNRYVANNLQSFRCPRDDAAPWTNDLSITLYQADSQFGWVGNSYMFNAVGYPLRSLPRRSFGLDGVRFSSIRNTSQTVVFLDGCLYYGFDWHYGHKGNVAFADGHVSFMSLPPDNEQCKWDP